MDPDGRAVGLPVQPHGSGPQLCAARRAPDTVIPAYGIPRERPRHRHRHHNPGGQPVHRCGELWRAYNQRHHQYRYRHQLHRRHHPATLHALCRRGRVTVLLVPPARGAQRYRHRDVPYGYAVGGVRQARLYVGPSGSIRLAPDAHLHPLELVHAPGRDPHLPDRRGQHVRAGDHSDSVFGSGQLRRHPRDRR